MYHISGDIRARKSAQHICDALMACARHKPFSEITVSDLSREHGVSRTTFYRLFDNTVDVLEYSCDQMGREILLKVRGDTPRALTINAITALKGQRALIELLSRSGHIDIFQKVQEKYLPLSALSAPPDPDPGSAYFHRILAHLIPIAMEIWVQEGQQDSPEEVYEKLRRSMEMLGQWFAE